MFQPGALHRLLHTLLTMKAINGHAACFPENNVAQKIASLSFFRCFVVLSQMARALLALARGLRRLQKSEQQSSMEAAASSGGRFELEWTSPEKSGSCVTTVEKPAAAHFGTQSLLSPVISESSGFPRNS